MGGPIFSGVMFRIFLNYRFVFIINFILLCITLLVAFKFVYGKQAQLENTQISACSIIKTNGNEQKVDDDCLFPSFIEFERKKQKEEKSAAADISSGSDSISTMHWIKLILICFQFGFGSPIIVIFTTYFLPFLLQQYDNINEGDVVFIASWQLVVASILFVLTTVIISNYNGLVKKLNALINPNVFVIGCAFFLSLLNLLFFHYQIIADYSIYSYFIFYAFTGIFYAILCIWIEYLFLDILPKRHSGKINGLKQLVVCLIKGGYLLSIGLLWNKTANAILIPLLIGMPLLGISCLLLFILSTTKLGIRKEVKDTVEKKVEQTRQMKRMKSM